MPPCGYWNREELYQEVWSTAMSTLAKKFGISNVGLAKVCKRLNVPVPGRGYWARKQAGQPIELTPLPQMADPPRVPKPQPRREPPSLVQTANQEECTLVDRLASLDVIGVLKRGSLSHALIVQARTVLNKARVDDRKILRARE